LVRERSLTIDDKLDISADLKMIDKEMEKDISQSVYSLKTGFYLESLKNQSKLDDMESFIELFESKNKSKENIKAISK